MDRKSRRAELERVGRSTVRERAEAIYHSDEMQALCFLAGANSMFYGEKLLTTGNPDVSADQQLLQSLGLRAAAPQARNALHDQPHAAPVCPRVADETAAAHAAVVR